MIEDFFLLFFGQNLHFFGLYCQINSALNFKSYNLIRYMESRRSPGFLSCPVGNFVFKKFGAVFKLMVKVSPHRIINMGHIMVAKLFSLSLCIIDIDTTSTSGHNIEVFSEVEIVLPVFTPNHSLDPASHPPTIHSRDPA